MQERKPLLVFKLFLCGIKDSRKFVFWTQSNIYDAFNQFQPSVAFDRETSHLICKANEMTGFYIKCNTGLQWVNLKFNGYSKQKFFKIYFNSFKYVNWINKGNIYLFKVNNWNIRKRGEICSKLIIKRAEPRQWRRLLFCCELWTYFTPISGVSTVDFKQVNVCWLCLCIVYVNVGLLPH